MGAFGLDPLIVQFALGNGKYLPGAIDDGFAGLPDNEGSGDHQAADLEMMPVPSLARARIKLLTLDFLETVGPSIAFRNRARSCRSPVDRPRNPRTIAPFSASWQTLAAFRAPHRRAAPANAPDTGL
ncbi:hypothetical protein [Bradyrhizobium tropiciagri]|uniref:hypothetical protein n=1 Tax=Bradyrhizobium tropiciagri TaxID=312253 RepID=UPI0010099C23|nr:hypothetical protein [Bradyrhizobium tropiciagri]